jgi:multidrug resistance protein, MATE family
MEDEPAEKNEAGMGACERPSFGEESRTTLKLAVPLISGQLSQMLTGVADTVMIGAVGMVPLGAATVANTLLAVPFVVGIGLLSAVSVRVSQAHGAGDAGAAGAALRHGTWLALAWGLAVTAGAGLSLPFLGLLGQPEEAVARAPVYLMTCAVSLVPVMLTMAWKNHADAMSRPWTPFWIGLGGIGLNVGLNWLWIHGRWGFPAMGLEGAGYATLVSRVAAAAALFVWMNRCGRLRQWLPERWLERCAWAGFKGLLALGVPASLHLLAEVTAFVTASLMIGTLGVAPLAAHQVAITCAATAFMVPLGVAMATTVRVGEIVGAGERWRLRRVLGGSWAFAAGFMTVSMGLFYFFGPQLAGWFVADAEVAAAAGSLLVVAALFQLFDGLQVVSVCALRGVDDVAVPAWMAAAASWGMALPLGYHWGLRSGWGATGVWAAMAVGLGVAAALLGRRAWRLLGARFMPDKRREGRHNETR